MSKKIVPLYILIALRLKEEVLIFTKCSDPLEGHAPPDT
jgi:hypothetical protein